MKGPGHRVRIQIRRHWRCEKCGQKRTTPGTVTALRCDACAAQPGDTNAWMQLVEGQISESLPEQRQG